MMGLEDKPFLLGWDGVFSGAFAVKLPGCKNMFFFGGGNLVNSPESWGGGGGLSSKITRSLPIKCSGNF